MEPPCAIPQVLTTLRLEAAMLVPEASQYSVLKYDCILLDKVGSLQEACSTWRRSLSYF